MSLTSPNVPSTPWVVRDARASSVIVQRVPAEGIDAFLEWERGITQAAEAFPGYRGTDLYPPAEGAPADWVAIVHFDNAAQLGRWLESPVRADWVARLPGGLRDFRLRTVSTGFSAWFTGQDAQPPGWKMVLAVLLGLYPTVMLLTIIIGPFLAPLGMSSAMLVSNALSVMILQWGVMPILQRFLSPWLVPGADSTRSRSAAWVVMILLILGSLAALFHLIKG